MTAVWRQVCSRCGRTWEPADLRWLCPCGGLLDMVGPVVDPIPAPGEGAGVPAGSYLRRYRFALPPGGDAVDLGASVTPAVEVRSGVWLKADYEQPTGSFKDRGAAVMIGTAAALGARAVLLDSSGNAGRSVAAHARRAGLGCTVYLPGDTPPAKIAAIAAHGAAVVTVPGGRSSAAVAAVEAASAPGASFYASHVYQPAFHHGVKTLAFELFEQVPDLAAGSVVVPAGNGTLVLGLWIGFGDLVAAGRMARRPAIVAVQADRCAPLVTGGSSPPRAGGAGGFPAARPAGSSLGPSLGPSPARPAGPSPAGPASSPATAAAGIAIAEPPRAVQIRGAVLASGGLVLAVAEEDIVAARDDLHGQGFPVEPTGAVAWAAVRAGLGRAGPQRGAGGSGPVVAVLTGR